MTPYEQSYRLKVVEALENWIDLNAFEDPVEENKSKELLKIMNDKGEVKKEKKVALNNY